MGRPKGSKNKPRTLPPPLEATSLNSMAFVKIPAGEPIGNNHILRQVRRPVGRPKDLKNKPKTSPPLTEIRSEILIHIPEGANIVQWLLEFCCCHQVSVTVLNASGQLANIIPYFQPNFNIPGPLPIVSLSGTVVPTPSPLTGATNWQETIFPFVVSLPWSDGAVCGGIVARSATAASTVNVVVMMTTLHNNNVTFETVSDDQANTSNIETTPVSDVPPQTQNLLFDDFHRLITEDWIELYDQANTSNIETTPASDVPPQTQNLSFDDFHRLVVEDRIELYDEFHRPVSWEII